jgi:nucleotide-binding universal stress UspA family protein
MRILLAVDKSDCSNAAARAVASQFAPQGNEVRVLYAADWERQLPPAYLFAQGQAGARAVVALQGEVLREAHDYVEGVAAPLRAAGFPVSVQVVSEGDARTVILDEAAKWPADLIVVGSHGRSGLDRFLLGSVSERVVRHAPCSVEVVRSRPSLSAAGVTAIQ